MPSEKPASPSTRTLYLSLPCIFLTATDKIEGAFSAAKEKGSHALGRTEDHTKREPSFSSPGTLHACFRDLLCVYSLQFRHRLALGTEGGDIGSLLISTSTDSDGKALI